MPSMEQLFTAPVGVTNMNNQPAITQSLKYVRGQVEAGIGAFTQWKAQVLALRELNTGKFIESFPWNVIETAWEEEIICGCFDPSEEKPAFCSELSAQLEAIINTVLCAVQTLMKNAELKQVNTLQGDMVKNKGETNTNFFNSTC